MLRKLGFALFLLFVFTSFLYSQDENPVKENYKKSEHLIKMRDGHTNFVSVYAPRDTTKDYPILMVRTPYTSAPYGEDNYKRRLHYNEYLEDEGYIFVSCDVRGMFMSAGDEYVDMRPYIPDKKGNEIDETTDTYDTIDWLINNIPHNNGKVGIWGISYPGFYASMGAIDAHPAVKAVSPQAPISDWFIGDDMHHNGAFCLNLAYNFFDGFGVPHTEKRTTWPGQPDYASQDHYNFFLDHTPVKKINEEILHGEIPFWNSFIEHGTYDEFWQSRNILPNLKNIKPAVMVVGGWIDHEDMYGAIETYKAMEAGTPKNNVTWIMGPWYHGAWSRANAEGYGALKFGENTSERYKKEYELKFFNHYLKDKGELNLPEVTVFDMGSNTWHEYRQWPPSNAVKKSLYLNESSSVSFSKPASAGTDEFESDPWNPVPYTAKFHSSRWNYNREYVVEDQRFASTRPDVLTYESEPLKEDITIAGPIEAELYVSITGTDADWIVKLIDVFPDDTKDDGFENDGADMGGFELLVRSEIMRGKFRNSMENPEPFTPGEVTKLTVPMNDNHYTFKKGHKIMVQIQSSWFPLFDINPQKFTDIYKADEDDFSKEAHTVYHTPEFPSCLKLYILN